MRLGVPKESKRGETRVAATPKTVEQLIKLGYDVVVDHADGPHPGGREVLQRGSAEPARADHQDVRVGHGRRVPRCWGDGGGGGLSSR